MDLPPFFFEVHRDMPRQGPGSDLSTRRALCLAGPLPKAPAILDIGCGPGEQTLCLARATGGHVTAVDTHQPFLDDLAQRASAAGLSGQITIRNQSMSELSDPDGAYDLVWCEGAVFIMGFEAGLRAWRRLLRPGGVLGLSESVWLTDTPPAAARAFWDSEYPAITSVEENLALLARSGYRLLGYFILPASDWMEGYYLPIRARLAALRPFHAGDPEAEAVFAMEEREIRMYEEHGDSYGYAFFIARRDD